MHESKTNISTCSSRLDKPSLTAGELEVSLASVGRCWSAAITWSVEMLAALNYKLSFRLTIPDYDLATYKVIFKKHTCSSLWWIQDVSAPSHSACRFRPWAEWVEPKRSAEVCQHRRLCDLFDLLPQLARVLVRPLFLFSRPGSTPSVGGNILKKRDPNFYFQPSIAT